MGVQRSSGSAVLWCLAALLSAFALPAFAAEQVITPDASSISVGPGQTVTVAVSYSTANPGDETLTGLGLRVHFDSTKLTFGSLTIVEDRDLLSQDSAPQSDATNFDNDASTDRFYNVAWTNFSGNWPGVGRTPDLLYRVTFTTASNFTGTTSIRFSASGTAAGYTLLATPVVVTASVTPDTTPPTLTLLGGATLNVTAGGTFTDPGATATDNVDGDISSRIAVTGSVNTAVTGTYTLTYNVSDTAGNAATARTRTVNVTPAADTTAPVLTLPANTSVEIESSAGTARNSARLTAFFAAASANDARDGAVSVTNDAPTVFPFGVTTVRFSATDAAGNTANGSATVTVVDTTAPNLVVPGNASVEIEGASGTARTSARLAAFFAGASASDVRDGSVTVTNDAPATLPFGTTTVTFRAVDAAGNTTSASRTVTVVDTTPPVLSVPPDVTVELENAAGTARTSAQLTAFFAAARANDIRDGSVTVTNDAPTTLPFGETTVTFRAQDAAGNESTPRTARIIVADRTGPVITLLGAASVNVIQNADYVEPGFTATDLRDGDVSGRVVITGAIDTTTVGAYTRTYTVTDLSGNAATSRTRTINVVLPPDGEAPQLTVPGAISVQAESAAGTPRSSAQLTAFFAAATATDVRDGTLVVTSNAPTTFPFGATMVTFSATDAAGNTVTSTVTVTVIDTVAPTVTAPSDVTVNATGRLTQVDVHASAATATDARDGAVTITVSGKPANDNYLSGRTVLTYTARDAAGNTATDEQLINVNPIIQLGANQQVSEGQRVVVPVMLGGDAPVYPVRATYSVSGTATSPDDHNAQSGELTIESGRAGTITFDVVRDSVGEAAETVVLRLTTATNAVVGARAAQTVEIVEANVAPVVDITLRQGGAPAARVLRSGGAVTATALVSDANSADTFTYDWSTSSSSLASTNGTRSSTFVFDPSAVAAGAYPLVVKVTDSANATTTRTLMVIVAAAPTLGTADTDGDGTNDTTEGTADTDGDGIANYLDADGNREFLPLQAGAGVTGRQMQTESGLRLALGAAALAANGSNAALSASDVSSFGDSGRASTASDSMFTYSLPFFDFVVDGAAPGDSVAVVIPLSAGLPSGTLSYRKLKGTSYVAFTENGANAVSSAAAVNGVCPPPRASAYTAGLVAGRTCVQLVIQDGGPNDLDGVTDGRVVDPGSVAAAVPPAPPASSTGGGGGGGCSVGDGAGDPTLPVLIVLGVAYVLRRRRPMHRPARSS